MNKELNQDFQQPNALAYLIIEEEISGQYIVFISKEDIEEYGEQDAARTLNLEFHDKSTIALQLTKLLMTEGFALTSFREVARETQVTFSLVDNTPGIARDTVAIHARVDIIDEGLLKRGEVMLAPLDVYAARMRSALFSHRLVDLGISRLLVEARR